MMASKTSESPQAESDHVLIVSSDGHVAAQMRDFRPYMVSTYHEEFDAFCDVYDEKGVRSFEPEAMAVRYDPDVIEDWKTEILDTGRDKGQYDLNARLDEMAHQGVVAEVLFPEFGVPFELYAPNLALLRGYKRTAEQIKVANSAYNRWLADFCSQAPGRFAGQARMKWDDIDAVLAEIHWAKNAGLRGVILPFFSEDYPIFHPRYEPIWSTLEELEMPINSHAAMSGIVEYAAPNNPSLPHPSVRFPLITPTLSFITHQLLNHLIWGGVLERHPDLQVVFTEQGTGWVIGACAQMDHSWSGSYLRRDIREVVPMPPSEYFKRQCHMGSSLFSRAEAEARDAIGVDKITIGLDYPHQEGSWGYGSGHVGYMKATLGAAHVSPEDARLMMGENAVKLWGFDRAALQPIVDATGPSLTDILTPPTTEEFPRGDVYKPLDQFI
jgi:predicted TIM-barrel fold metal-dependent hydrolase